MASARLENSGGPNSMRQGPTRSIMERRTGSDFLRCMTALRMVHKAIIRVGTGRIENEYFPKEAGKHTDPSRCGDQRGAATRRNSGFMLSTPKVLDQIFRGSERKRSQATAMP